MEAGSIANKCRTIAEVYGARYQIEEMEIKQWPPQLLIDSGFDSLLFWFSKSFYRGRNDILSTRFLTSAISVLKNIGENRLRTISEEELTKALWEAEVNNQTDRRMVTQSLKYIYSLPEGNLAAYAVQMIKNGQIQQIHHELNTIYGIGEKLASFYLRDICFIYQIEPEGKEQIMCTQPVDNWVKRVTVRLGIPGCTEDKWVEAIVEPVVDFCLQYQISPLKFNAGAWFVGSKSFDLLLELI